jgi:hypothetical protein
MSSTSTDGLVRLSRKACMMGASRPLMDSKSQPAERRVVRLPLPPCEECASTNVHVATRVDRFLYFRCRDCRHTWSVEKPVPEWTAPSS